MTTVFSAARIDAALLLSLTTPSYYARGVAYAAQGRAMLDRLEPLCVEATVSGSEDYSVQLAWRDGSLHGTCDCPIGQQEEFCKHQVAVALTWARQVGGGQAPAASRR
ncbi:hypothetical protein DXO331_20765, partial [Xanthomonas oryzae pv. oryzae]